MFVLSCFVCFVFGQFSLIYCRIANIMCACMSSLCNQYGGGVLGVV